MKCFITRAAFKSRTMHRIGGVRVQGSEDNRLRRRVHKALISSTANPRNPLKTHPHPQVSSKSPSPINSTPYKTHRIYPLSLPPSLQPTHPLNLPLLNPPPLPIRLPRIHRLARLLYLLQHRLVRERRFGHDVCCLRVEADGVGFDACWWGKGGGGGG